MTRRAIEMAGQVFARLTVVERVESLGGSGKSAVWRCRCTCGKMVPVEANRLRRGEVKSCGCLRRETTRQTGMDSARKRAQQAKARSHKRRPPTLRTTPRVEAPAPANRWKTAALALADLAACLGYPASVPTITVAPVRWAFDLTE